MTDFIRTRDLLDNLRRDPKTAARMDQRLTADIKEQEKLRQRDIMRIFADVTRAQSLPQPERQQALDGVVTLILDDPGLAYAFTEEIEDLQDDPSERVHQLLLDAADPITGELPADIWQDIEHEGFIANQPEWQEYRDGRSLDVRGDASERIRNVAEDMQPILEQWHGRRRISAEWMFIDFDEADVIEEQFAFVNRSFVLKGADDSEESESSQELEPGDVRTLFADDPDGFYRLGETRIYEGDNQYTVILRAYVAGTQELLADTRDGWRIYASVGDRQLEVAPDDFATEAWRLADTISGDDLALVTYEVELV